MSRLKIFLFALALVTTSAVSAQAQAYLTGHPGAACHPTNSLQETYYRYERGQLVNTGTRALDVLFASCPLWEPPRDNYHAVEIRAYLRDSQHRNSACVLYDGDAHQVGSPRRVTFYGDDLGEADFSISPQDPQGFGLDYTVECIIWSGARMSTFGVIWEH